MPRNSGTGLVNRAIRVTVSGGKMYPVFSEERCFEFLPDGLPISVDASRVVMDELQFSD